MLMSERGGERDLERALRLGAAARDLGIRILDFGEYPRAGVVVTGTFDCQMQAARRAVQEPDPEARLQCGKASAHQGWGQAEVAGRRR
jgi:hypothetical protein